MPGHRQYGTGDNYPAEESPQARRDRQIRARTLTSANLGAARPGRPIEDHRRPDRQRHQIPPVVAPDPSREAKRRRQAARRARALVQAIQASTPPGPVPHSHKRLSTHRKVRAARRWRA